MLLCPHTLLTLSPYSKVLHFPGKICVKIQAVTGADLK
jgi:hypothetical protein